MVIKVLFSKKINTTHAELPLVLTKFFEVDAMPEKSRIIRKLKDMGSECFSASLAVKIHDQDAAMMRSSGILVAQLWWS
jgi:hypothetical protein